MFLWLSRELNPEHLDLIDVQKKRLGTKRGFIVVKPNCSIQSYTPEITAPLWSSSLQLWLQRHIRLYQVQAKHLRTGWEILDNVIPFINGEEEKSEQEPLRIWGKLENGTITKAAAPVITTQCLRVPVSNGHTACFVSFKHKPTKRADSLKNGRILRVFLRTDLPSAPKQFITF